ncbi:uncharacterized protein [Struthio camelus]|uniref:uncharacterized protein isoform X4 n=1 Tax=Struthio camelus TaxID=8801 RepID=UPI003603B2CB
MEPANNSDAAAPPLPSLIPRHRELIPTPCGPIKPCSELSFPVKIYFCVTILSLLSVIGLTIETLTQQTEEDFTISFIQLVGVVFCVYYVTRGILQENRQELVVFVLSILLVMFRSTVNFTVLSAEQKPKLLLCLCVLLTSLREITLLHNIISAAGVLWACLKVTISIIAILKELKPLVWIFLSQNVPEVVYLIYLLYMVIHETCLIIEGKTDTDRSPIAAVIQVLGVLFIKACSQIRLFIYRPLKDQTLSLVAMLSLYYSEEEIHGW